VRIEVGYGLEGTLTDALSSVIIASAIVPRFKANDYAGGIERGVEGVIAVLTTDAAEWREKAKVRADDPPALVAQLAPLLIFGLFLFVVLAMIANARGSSGRWVRRGRRLVFLPPARSPWPETWDGGGSGWSWGGGSSGGSSGGGGFSGGGGSSGGGGASGTW
jgi:uncharacterized protein